MYITELDEYQGLTADMVRGWLKAREPRITLDSDGWWFWAGMGLHVCNRHLSTALDQALCDIAFCERVSAQALLREINPRMRKGWPSDEAIAAARKWVAKHPKGVIFVGEIRDDPERGPGLAVSLTTRLDKSQADGWSFWPCDEHGNKTRWPVDAEGNML